MVRTFLRNQVIFSFYTYDTVNISFLYRIFCIHLLTSLQKNETLTLSYLQKEKMTQFGRKVRTIPIFFQQCMTVQNYRITFLSIAHGQGFYFELKLPQHYVDNRRNIKSIPHYVPMIIFDPNLCAFKFLPHSFRMIPNLWLPPEKMWAKTVGKLDSLFRPCEQYGASWPPPQTSTQFVTK